ncbi:MAG: CHASE3 domain-containing protein [Micropepsaceae bacterium]
MASRAMLIRSIAFAAAGFALLALVLIGTFWISGRQQAAMGLVEHTLQVQRQINLIYTRVLGSESADRGYLLVGDPAYLAPYQRFVESYGADMRELERLVSDNPSQLDNLAKMKSLIDQRLILIQKKIDLNDAGQREKALELLKNGQGFDLSEQIRRVAADMYAEEESLLAKRRAESDNSAEALQIGLMLAFAVMVIVAMLAFRDQRTRLNQLVRARDSLAEANSRLHAEAVTRERAEAQVRQMQKMESVGQLTGGIAHDFNNMLAIIIGSLDLAKRRMASDPEKAATGIANAADAAQRAAQLTSRLLAFSRQQPLAPGPIEANKLVGGMSELLRRTIGEDILLETVLAGGLWRCYADGPQLENAVLNLCVNARDAMPEGGKLTIETANTWLDDAYAAAHGDVTAGQYVAICVTDTGAGMSKETLERAFDPFYTTKGIGKGTGLGLSQVFGFVKQSGGHVKIYSEVGQGTSVKMYLPRFTGEAATEDTPHETYVGGGDEIILVVEDDADVRLVSVDSLRALGYTVIHAEDGPSALALMDRHPKIDLLFTDVVMPGMSGRQLADKTRETRPEIKVLYATGYTRNAVVHNGMLDAGVALLSKPFTIDQLASKVRSVLDGGGINRKV